MFLPQTPRMVSPSLQRLYRELYHKLKDKIHTTPDTPEIRQVKKTQEAVSEVRMMGQRGHHRGRMLGSGQAITQGETLAICSLV